MTEATIPARAATADSRRGRRSWIIVALVNALPVLFGSSYIWWPSRDVIRYDGTNGLIHVDRYAWGIFVMISAATMLTVALAGLRQGRRWAWLATWYDVAFFASVAVLEPDYFFPVVLAIIVSTTLLYARRRFTN